ncbi:yrdC domain-containing protein [Salpingoeca rosetta]|uniref:Threonylcarbamoyl-AMP synthase n=1 Tax=Salpingoeca rosetta (strain ATCC 50818 / BSB-021) TaxID=946362 RepID=F2UHZ0_SALR5|nr:yrdC domain-containing protein [Salpingoeca rosetta]EGD76739.1 yrdC domain-containing protein [Salpingoeca rosetta]|eukprot:XP_004991111.1 yrdC domain-containing protein [Salpingoeca rosetta]
MLRVCGRQLRSITRRWLRQPTVTASMSGQRGVHAKHAKHAKHDAERTADSTNVTSTTSATADNTNTTTNSNGDGSSKPQQAQLGRVVKIAGNQEDVPDDVVADAVETLRAGGVIGVPTDTIYGLACLAQSTQGVRRIYSIKGRSELKPIAICVHDVAAIGAYAELSVPERLLRALLPGPVTVVLPRKPALNPELNPHTSLIGVRVPDFPFVRKLVQALGEPLALTSANRSGEQSCISSSEFSHLWGELNAVYDAGTIETSGASRLGSTVVDLSRGKAYQVIRGGSAEEATLATLHAHGLRAAAAAAAGDMQGQAASTQPASTAALAQREEEQEAHVGTSARDDGDGDDGDDDGDEQACDDDDGGDGGDGNGELRSKRSKTDSDTKTAA